MGCRAVTTPPVIVDSSALIGFEAIGQLHLFERLFGGIVIPRAVARETARSVHLRDWIRVEVPVQALPPQILDADIGRGESECIALALGGDIRWLVLDDLLARRLAESLGLPVIGALGILKLAKISGYIDSLTETVTALRSTGFFAGDRIVQRLLDGAGEG